jgi:hypothetical protein
VIGRGLRTLAERTRLVDASVVCEPGATGSTWRLHYMIDLSTLACEQVQVGLKSNLVYGMRSAWVD